MRVNVRVNAEIFLWGHNTDPWSKPMEGFYCLIKPADSVGINSLSEYTATIKTLLELYGWNGTEEISEEFCSGKKLQKFRMPRKALISSYYQKLLF